MPRKLPPCLFPATNKRHSHCCHSEQREESLRETFHFTQGDKPDVSTFCDLVKARKEIYPSVENDDPQPQVRAAFGLTNLKPAPCRPFT